ncbi:hypothetical protein NHH73_16450 [Oxalobacteraceae bacterium OTU3CINTB1]|nr:hypothetical protein NHH73_16450 [Oxalobacteraceae bacterium OTU3CINTB1]
MKFQFTAIGLACATLLAACGGGGGGGGGGEGGMAQSVSFPFPGGEVIGVPPTVATITLKATASSGGPVTYVSNTPGTCSISGATVSLLKAGECSLNANQAGGDGYAPATARQLFVIPKRPASVSFRNPGGLPLDTVPVPLVASSNAALPVVFTTSTPEVCSVSGNTMQKLANGLCVVTATADGADIYETAKVVKTIPVGSALAPEIKFLSGYKNTTTTNEDGKVDPHGGSSTRDWWCNGWCDASVSADGASISDTYTWKQEPYTDGRWWKVFAELDVFAPKVTQISTTGDTPDGVRIDAQAAVKFNLSQNQEWFDTGDNVVEVDLILGHYNRKKDNGNCNVRVRASFKPNSPAPASYSLNLKDFTVSESCELTDLNPWFEMQDYPVVAIRFASANGNAKVPSRTLPAPNYPTTITLTGPITIQ